MHMLRVLGARCTTVVIRDIIIVLIWHASQSRKGYLSNVRCAADAQFAVLATSLEAQQRASGRLAW